ncbi:MAG: hypothetical protein ACFHX7_24515 [Pseudomonadota bacterium]
MARWLVLMTVAILLTGCVNADRIKAIPADEARYAELSCVQLANEQLRLTDEVLRLTGRKTDDEVAVIYLARRVLFLPILFVMEDSDTNKEKVAMLKGEYEAVENLMINKRCSAT